jgi:hypothetical protein
MDYPTTEQIICSRVTTWNEAADAAVSDIDEYVGIKAPSPTIEIAANKMRVIHTSIENTVNGTWTSGNIKDLWTTLGGIAYGIYRFQFNGSQDSVVNTLIKKQRDYGPENINKFGQYGLVVRTHDKIARLENLISKQTAPENEAMQDTFLDIVGYSAIGIMLVREMFNYPLA